MADAGSGTKRTSRDVDLLVCFRREADMTRASRLCQRRKWPWTGM